MDKKPAKLDLWTKPKLRNLGELKDVAGAQGAGAQGAGTKT